MAIEISIPTQNIATDAVVDSIDVGAGANGTLEIRSGAPPATANDVDTGTLIVTINLSATAYGASASGTAALAGTPLSANAVASATAGHFRVKDADGDVVFQGTVGTSATDLILDNASINSGQTVNVSSLNVTMPAEAS